MLESICTFYCRQLPDQIWVQCDNPDCLKWRKLPDGTDPQKLPDKWYCKENPNPRMRSCSIPEEKEEEVEQPYVKTQKKRLWVNVITILFFLSVPLWNNLFGVNVTFSFISKSCVFVHLEELRQKFSRWSSVIQVNLLHYHPCFFSYMVCS